MRHKIHSVIRRKHWSPPASRHLMARTSRSPGRSVLCPCSEQCSIRHGRLNQRRSHYPNRQHRIRHRRWSHRRRSIHLHLRQTTHRSHSESHSGLNQKQTRFRRQRPSHQQTHQRILHRRKNQKLSQHRNRQHWIHHHRRTQCRHCQRPNHRYWQQTTLHLSPDHNHTRGHSSQNRKQTQRHCLTKQKNPH